MTSQKILGFCFFNLSRFRSYIQSSLSLNYLDEFRKLSPLSYLKTLRLRVSGPLLEVMGSKTRVPRCKLGLLDARFSVNGGGCTPHIKGSPVHRS